MTVRSLSRRLTMAMTDAPRARARSTVRLVSVVEPDWLTAMTHVSERFSSRPYAENSLAGIDCTVMLVGSSERRVCAMPWAATPAVPCPSTATRRTSSFAMRCRSACGKAEVGRSTAGRSSAVRTRPRSVLRNEAAASRISFSR